MHLRIACTHPLFACRIEPNFLSYSLAEVRVNCLFFSTQGKNVLSISNHYFNCWKQKKMHVCHTLQIYGGFPNNVHTPDLSSGRRERFICSPLRNVTKLQFGVSLLPVDSSMVFEGMRRESLMRRKTLCFAGFHC